MTADIKRAYSRAREEISADGIIPSGEFFGKMTAGGAKKLYRDTFHASYGLGRYALSLLWYRSLTGRSVLGNTFSDFDEPMSAQEIELAKNTAESFGKII